MTTLIAVQKNGDVELGWDAQMTRANEVSFLKTPKMFVNGDVIYGVTGILRAGDLIETAEFPPYDGSDPRKWIIREMVPELKALFRDEPVLLNEEGAMNEWGLMMIVDGEAFLLDSLFNPTQSIEGIYTMGSGGDYARGALFAGTSVMGALVVAASIDPYTGGALTTCLASKFLEANSEHTSAGDDARLETPTRSQTGDE